MRRIQFRQILIYFSLLIVGLLAFTGSMTNTAEEPRSCEDLCHGFREDISEVESTELSQEEKDKYQKPSSTLKRIILTARGTLDESDWIYSEDLMTTEKQISEEFRNQGEKLDVMMKRPKVIRKINDSSTLNNKNNPTETKIAEVLSTPIPPETNNKSETVNEKIEADKYLSNKILGNYHTKTDKNIFSFFWTEFLIHKKPKVEHRLEIGMSGNRNYTPDSIVYLLYYMIKERDITLNELLTITRLSSMRYRNETPENDHKIDNQLLKEEAIAELTDHSIMQGNFGFAPWYKSIIPDNRGLGCAHNGSLWVIPKNVPNAKELLANSNKITEKLMAEAKTKAIDWIKLNHEIKKTIVSDDESMQASNELSQRFREIAFCTLYYWLTLDSNHIIEINKPNEDEIVLVVQTKDICGYNTNGVETRKFKIKFKLVEGELIIAYAYPV